MDSPQKDKWSEQDSRKFIDYSDFFVPHRQQQADIICQLLDAVPSLQLVVDLCCGAGFLSKNILEKFPEAEVHGYDLSDEMLSEARSKLKNFSPRFSAYAFNLAETNWRASIGPADAFVSSLAVHHLNAQQKQQLFQDLQERLHPGGALLIADIIRPVTQKGHQVAASLWEQWVRETTEEAGNLEAYQEFVDEKWNYFKHPDADTIDQPSGLSEQLNWLENAGFKDVEVYWMTAGHAIFGGWKVAQS
ncbi:tRNA (cmo5U34)-methyltransferase [Catalinimonas alkaloidigena]|uniref:class I SAM-dependent methyltransferase n=1 Tax=Catalinimonas alkaloidigena TaxID=1075417 RepID=UPI00240654DC|nr:class I SAM-dependent methyltransferase [Catalinimonas alkaloidigena]MDF9798685.1 tRNA (cmo5U34)-methyltransferase [Catalinimonas alkaloidigena]